jgi:hypothetical protein
LGGSVFWLEAFIARNDEWGVLNLWGWCVKVFLLFLFGSWFRGS